MTSAAPPAPDPGKSTPPLFSGRVTRRLWCVVGGLLVVVQAVYLARIGNGPGKHTDGFSEVNLVRAVDAYLHDGLTSHHGLPRFLYRYQRHFPGQGMEKDVLGEDGSVSAEFRRGFPAGMEHPDQWVYTHYPPGSELLGALVAKVVGWEPLWRLRLFPVGFGLLAAAVFFRALTVALGADRAVLAAAACVAAPSFHLCMPSLQYQGYSFALLLLELSLLLRALWTAVGPRAGHGPVCFLLGFLQGWLSFDQCFVVSLLPVPLWLLRRAEGNSPGARWLAGTVGALGAGFALAHLLHFWQVAAELGGLPAAWDEFRRTAGERAGRTDAVALPRLLVKYLHWETGQFGYGGSLALAGYYYVRALLLWRGIQFGPLLLLALVAGLFAARGRRSKSDRPVGAAAWLKWPGPRSALPALGAALVVSVFWLLVMPAHVVGNHHITVRHLFVLYFCLVLVLAKSVSFPRRPAAPAAAGPVASPARASDAGP
jgi:hypothetical protein